MKKTSYKGKTTQDLLKSLQEKRDALRKAKFGATGSKTRNVKESANMRKEIARILTALNTN